MQKQFETLSIFKIRIQEWGDIKYSERQRFITFGVIKKKTTQIMNKILLLSIISMLQFLVKAQDSASVLFIGNSYTYVNDLPSLLQSVVDAQGDYLYVDSRTQGGATFQTHVDNASTYTKINGYNWDYVVLQAQSQEPSFPDSQVNSTTLPNAQRLADSIYANNFCSEVLMFMTWGRENGDPQWQPISTFEGMNERLRLAYLRMADSVQGSTSPVGSAWRYVRENYPSIQLYAGDGSHPSYAGSYLAACTFYASIYRKTPVGTSFIGSLSAQDAQNLQTAAALTVLDSLDFFNLRPISEHTQAMFSTSNNDPNVSFNNQSTKVQNYYWDFGDGVTSTDENPTHSYTSNGTFTVTMIAESPCDTDTTVSSIVIGLAGIDDLSAHALTMKTHAEGVYEIVGENKIEKIEVWSITGAKMNVVSQSIIDLSLESKGVYFINVSVENEIIRLKVMR